MRIVIIGGGSYQWAFGFVWQFVGSERLAGSTVVLVDIDPEALALVEKAVGICNRRAGDPITIEATGDRRAALDGADFVLVAISTGALDAMAADVEIPQRYGIWHPVGDTVGPGGWMRAVRNVPVFRAIAADMRELCPRAWMLNVSNPLSVLTRVPEREFGIRTVGLCPGAEGHAATLVHLAGFGEDARVDYVLTGIDHGSWFTDLRADGADVLAALREKGYCRAEGPLPSEVATDDAAVGQTGSRAAFAVWDEIGYMPAISDRHCAENWPWFLARENPSQIPFGIRRTTIDERRDAVRARRERLEQYVATDGADERGGGHGDDPVCAVIESLAGFRSFVYSVNVANVGQIPQLPTGAVVETRARFDACGVHPEASPMPPVLQALVAPHVLRQEAIVDVASTGTFDELVALVRTDPLCSRLEPGACRRMVAEMVEGTRPWIANPRLLEG